MKKGNISVLLAILIFTGLHMSCKKSVKSVVDTHQKKIESKLKAIEDIAKKIKDIPAITENKKIKLDTVLDSNIFAKDKKENKVLTTTKELITAKDLAAPETSADFDFKNFYLINDAAALVKWGKKHNKLNLSYPKDGEKTFQFTVGPFLKISHIIVIREVSYTPPKVMSSNKFKPGEYTGEALLFDIEQRKYVGGLKFKAKNDPEVEVNVDHVENWINSNLRNKASKSLDRVLKKYAPAIR